jgi:hypothetical protein
MMRIPVVASQLFSHGNVTSGIEFHSSISNADKHVGITGMIDKLEGSTANAPSMAWVALSSTMTIRFAPFTRFLASRTEICSPVNSPSFVRIRTGQSVNSPLPWIELA